MRIGIDMDDNEKARLIAEWIWKKVGLDPEDESWRGMMITDAIKEIRKLISGGLL